MQLCRDSILRNVSDCGAKYRRLDRYGLVLINDEFTVCIRVVFSVAREKFTVWKAVVHRSRPPDIWLIARVGVTGIAISDYLVLPSSEVKSKCLFTEAQTKIALSSFRFDTLEPFLSLCRRKPI